MNINSVGNSYSSLQTQAAPRTPTPEAAEVKKTGKDNDGDSDDGGAVKAVQAAPAPTVNANGQQIGRIISVSA